MTTPDIPPWAKGDLWLDENNFLDWVTWKPEGPNALPYMALWFHRPKNPQTHNLDSLRGWCVGSFGWRNPDTASLNGRVTWTLDSWNPFTISPSLRCSDCGAHGFIREGKWLPV